MKAAVSAILLAFVAVSLAYLVLAEVRSNTNDRNDSASASAESGVDESARGVTATGIEEPSSTPKLIAYYFHRHARCKTCLAIEAFAHEALTEAFPEALESGEVQWQALNLDLPEYEHFAADYGLISSSLVLVKMHEGQQQEWRILEEVWDLVDDEASFKAYVAGEARALLENGS